MALSKTTALRVSPTTESKIRTLAAKINPKFRWQTEGPKVLALIDLLLDDLAGQPGRKPGKAAVIEYVSGIILDLDESLAWDSPGCGESTEDQFLTFVVGRRVAQRWQTGT